MMPNWKQLQEDILSLFLHPNCSICGRSAEDVLCYRCEQKLDRCRLLRPVLPAQGNHSLIGWGEYGGILKRSIATLKYDHQPQLARPLGKRLGETWLKHAHFQDSLKPVVVPIPLHPEKEKKRGYNQAELIARSFCAVTGLKLKPKALTRIKNTEALFGLTPQERQQQLTDAFFVGKGLKPQQNVILLDDIYTTGTTVKTAQMVLQQAGVTVISVCAVAVSQAERSKRS